MVRDDLLNYFPDYTSAATALGLGRTNITQWAKLGIPLIQQLRIEVATGGVLRADRAAIAERAPELLAMIAGYESMRGGVLAGAQEAVAKAKAANARRAAKAAAEWAAANAAKVAERKAKAATKAAAKTGSVQKKSAAKALVTTPIHN